MGENGASRNSNYLRVEHARAHYLNKTQQFLRKTQVYEEKKIPDSLLNRLHLLQNLGYRYELRDFIDDYAKVRDENEENETIKKALKKFWSKKYGKEESAKVFESFRVFEPILKGIRNYRDHFVHPFQVFLLGSIIIDCFYRDFCDVFSQKITKVKDDSLDFSWMLSSTFHDICYPIQMFNDFSEKLFNEFLQASVPIEIDFNEFLFERDILKYIDQLAVLQDYLSDNTISKTRWFFDSSCIVNDEIRSLLLEKMTERNHGLLSALALLKRIRIEKQNEPGYLKGRFSTDVYPAALAIAMHDENVFRRLKTKIYFEKSPITFLLIYCDTAQDWGRPIYNYSVDFSNLTISSNEVGVTLDFRNTRNFKTKMKKIDLVFDKLESEKLKFSLTIQHNGRMYSRDSLKK